MRPLPSALVLLIGLAVPAEAVVRGQASRDPDGLRASTVRVENSHGELCSGAIIAPDVVLTAAHCVLQRSRYRVVATDRRFKTRTLAASQVTVHPAFVPGTTPRGQPGIDLALIKLDRPVGDDFVPLDPAATVAVEPGERMVLAGFGVTSEGRAASARTLRETELVALGALQVANTVLVGVDPERYAARTGAGACRGDSGGPILRREANGAYRLLGIVSWSSGAFEERRAGACGGFTAVTPLSEHGSWVAQSAQSLGRIATVPDARYTNR